MVVLLCHPSTHNQSYNTDNVWNPLHAVSCVCIPHAVQVLSAIHFDTAITVEGGNNDQVY